MHAAVHLVRALGPEPSTGPQESPGSQGMSRTAERPPPSRVLVITTGPATKVSFPSNICPHLLPAYRNAPGRDLQIPKIHRRLLLIAL